MNNNIQKDRVHKIYQQLEHNKCRSFFSSFFSDDIFQPDTLRILWLRKIHKISISIQFLDNAFGENPIISESTLQQDKGVV